MFCRWSDDFVQHTRTTLHKNAVRRHQEARERALSFNEEPSAASQIGRKRGNTLPTDAESSPSATAQGADSSSNDDLSSRKPVKLNENEGEILDLRKSEFRADLVTKVKNEVKADLLKQIKDEVETDLIGKIKSDMEADVVGKVKSEIEAELMRRIKSEMEADIRRKIQSEMEAHLKVKTEKETDSIEEIKSKFEADIQANKADFEADLMAKLWNFLDVEMNQMKNELTNISLDASTVEIEAFKEKYDCEVLNLKEVVTEANKIREFLDNNRPLMRQGGGNDNENEVVQLKKELIVAQLDISTLKVKLLFRL